MGFKHIEAHGEADKLCAALVKKIKYMVFLQKIWIYLLTDVLLYLDILV